MPPRPPRPTVAYQGERGAYSEDAVAALFGDAVEPLPCLEFRDAFEAVDTGQATHAVVPVENSIEGTVAQVNDLLLEHDLTVAGEVIMVVDHCLIANPKAKLEHIKVVYSHPQALGQCRRFLSRHPAWKQVPAYDTAGSVKMIRERGRKDEAAIASRRSARIYGMKVLAEGIQTDHENYTRFFVVEKHPRRIEGADKTSIAFVAKNVPGSLHACLGEFAKRGINLTKLESRPRSARPWNYVFYADFEGSMEDSKVRDAVGALVTTAGFVKVFGFYRKATPPAPR
ncbi:MAG: prephenate dehydratase [Thermoplasmata archaeon]